MMTMTPPPPTPPTMAALTKGSTSTLTGGHTAVTIQDWLARLSINQLSTNQTVLMYQMAEMSFNNAPTPPPTQFAIPPTQQLTIPTQVLYHTGSTMGGFNVG